MNWLAVLLLIPSWIALHRGRRSAPHMMVAFMVMVVLFEGGFSTAATLWLASLVLAIWL